MSLKIATLELTSDKYIPYIPEKFRGYIANRNIGNPLFHQHLQEKNLVYRYPQIHYLVLNGKAIIVGVKNGADEIPKLFNDIDELIMGDEKYCILDKQLSIKTHNFNFIDHNKSYFFVTPWLALNEVNFMKFRDAEWMTRKKMLARILIGNILSALKGLQIKVEEKINVEINYVRAVNCSLKGSSLIGFYGSFKINLELPPLFGVGKSVSRGFGAILEE